MKKYSEEELKEKYRNLPKRLKEALSDPEISKKISRIGKDLQIAEVKLEDLTKICGWVFLGLLPQKKLHKELKNFLALSDEVSKSLAKKIESEVFSEYKEDLENIYKVEEKTPEEIEEKKLKELLEEMKAKGFEEPKPTEKAVLKPEERKIEIKEELLKKKGPDKYREPIEKTETEKERQARIVKEGGRIKRIF